MAGDVALERPPLVELGLERDPDPIPAGRVGGDRVDGGDVGHEDDFGFGEVPVEGELGASAVFIDVGPEDESGGGRQGERRQDRPHHGAGE